jgi:phosphatidylglycerophosphatase A
MRWLAKIIATGFGVGFAPVAPGTFGTLLAIPLVYGASQWGTLPYVLACVAVTGLGIWAADVHEEARGEHDLGEIVVDEFAGFFVTMLAVDRTKATHYIAGFLLFRLFDIWKPGPIRILDRRVGGGFGVVVDDLAAAVAAATLLWTLDRTEVLTHIADLFA